jgi:hypothetical protein
VFHDGFLIEDIRVASRVLGLFAFEQNHGRFSVAMGHRNDFKALSRFWLLALTFVA